jgi:catechol 2,3-dioxygenase-like lactoylglutathione lyase family enzyme
MMTRSPNPLLPAIIAIAAFAVRPGAQQAGTFPYDHIHLSVDGAAGSAWYEKNFGGKRISEAPNRLMYGSTRLMFLGARQNVQPSSGSSIDHIGFSVKDLDAKMKELEANGVKIVQPVRNVPKLFKFAFVEDPWGTRIEVVEDPELTGLHHMHLRAPNPEDAFTWLLDKFGGERTRLKGMLDAIRYRADGFSDVWILVEKGEAAPSQGRAIDHIGWRSTGDLKQTMDGLGAKGASIATQPRALKLPGGPPINYAYVNGPSGAYIEIVERPGLKPGE